MLILGLGNWILEVRKLVKGVMSVCLARVAGVEERVISELLNLLLNEGNARGVRV
jgi:hypothetical protein